MNELNGKMLCCGRGGACAIERCYCCCETKNRDDEWIGLNFSFQTDSSESIGIRHVVQLNQGEKRKTMLFHLLYYYILFAPTTTVKRPESLSHSSINAKHRVVFSCEEDVLLLHVFVV